MKGSCVKQLYILNMSFTKKATFLQQEYEYQSVDGEIYSVTVVETHGKMYFKWVNPSNKTNENVVIDAEMLRGLYNILCEITGENTVKTNKTQLNKPKIYDHRNNPSTGTYIDRQVEKTLENGNNDQPIESFSSYNKNEIKQSPILDNLPTKIDINDII